ncbi:GGDEF domain-containing protein [Domibacillus robiginosus]|uniref:GGDEF domain-containing protein n=1 Tax=Domibacillus robiginosus TaxID=1071054 RepID=UPI00067D1BFE|nr:diguanylate cyclase [Domibacillus robiginosus]
MMNMKEFITNASILMAIITMAGLLYKQFLVSAGTKLKNALLLAMVIFSGWASMLLGIQLDDQVIFDLRFVPIIVAVLLMQKKRLILLAGLGIGLARLSFGVSEAAVSGFWTVIAVSAAGAVLHIMFSKWTSRKKVIWTVLFLNSVNVLFIAFLGVTPARIYLVEITPIALPTSLLLSFLIVWMISDLRREFLSKQHLLESARRDPLTKLYNRRAFMAYFQQFSDGKRGKKPFVLVFIDIDHFKQVNDTYGHIVGDCVLKAVSGRLLNNLRSIDIIARYGGEEFVVILPDCTKENALLAIERIREIIARQPVFVNNVQVSVTFSAGLASSVEFASDQLLKKADHALYEAKQAGRNRTICAEPAAACS